MRAYFSRSFSVWTTPSERLGRSKPLTNATWSASTSGCEAGEKCATRFLQMEPTALAEIACVPDGTIAVDGACQFGPSGGNCSAPAMQPRL